VTVSPLLFAEYAKLAKTFGLSKFQVESADGAKIEMEFGGTPEGTIDLGDDTPKVAPGMQALADLLNVPVESVKGPPLPRAKDE
jgi:hypothetical protein